MTKRRVYSRDKQRVYTPSLISTFSLSTKVNLTSATSFDHQDSSTNHTPSHILDLPLRSEHPLDPSLAPFPSASTANGSSLPVEPPAAPSASLTRPSSRLSTFLSPYITLSKPRLTFLMVLTTATSYSLYPTPELLHPPLTPTLSFLTLAFLLPSTTLCVASANTFNMYLEPIHDAKMSRTRNRPLVRGIISKRSALLFGIACGILGTAGLYYGVNPIVAALGVGNIILYAGIYTPLKRIHVINTWVGALVGAIPPLMGWAAASGQVVTSEPSFAETLLGPANYGGWLLAALLYAWQFPHFNALSYSIRAEYAAAGYKMLASVNQAMNARVALRYSILLFPICWGLAYVGVTDWGYVVSSSAVNAWMLRDAWRFWRYEGKGGSARGLFWASVWHLPGLMVLAMAHKKVVWDGVCNGFVGQGEEEDLEEDDDEQVVEVVRNRTIGSPLVLKGAVEA